MAGSIEKTIKAIREINYRFDEMGKKIGHTAVVTREIGDRMVSMITRVQSRFVGGKKVGETVEEEEISEGKGKKESKFGKTMKKVGSAFKAVGKGVKAVGGGIWGMVSRFVDFGVILKVLEPIFAPINALLSIFAGTLGQTLQPVIKEFFEVLMDPQIIEIVTLLGEIIGQVLVAAIRIVIAIINELKAAGVFDFLIDVLTSAVEGVTWFADNLDVVWEAIVVGFNAVVDFFTSIGEFFIAAWETIVFGFETLVSFFVGIWEGVVSFFEDVVDFFDMIWNAIIVGFYAFVNFFIGIINGVIDLLNAADFADVFEDIPRVATLSVPAAQTGAYIRRGGLIRVHDNEAILNREQTQNLLTADNSKQIVINFNDPVLLDEENARQLIRLTERVAMREMS